MGDVVAYIVGLVVGFVSGLFPAIHSNTVISILSALDIPERDLAIMIIALYPATLITSFVPAIFFGVPDSSTVVAVLPGQRMVLSGKGLAAIKTMIFSSIVSVCISAILIYPSLGIFPIIYGTIRSQMQWVLLIFSIIFLSRSKRLFFAIFIFLIAGLLGYYSLNSQLNDPFLPLFSGMFALAGIVNYKKSAVPEQAETPIEFDFLRFSIVGVGLGFLADFIPGVGSPAQVATFATMIMPINTLGYLATISSLSISQALFSFSTAVSIDKSRVGATASLAKIMDIRENFLMIVILFILSIAITSLVVYLLRRYFGKISSFDFSKVNYILAAYLISITFLIDGFLGLMVLIISTGLGWLTLRMGVERTTLMGAIIIPTLLLLFRIFL